MVKGKGDSLWDIGIEQQAVTDKDEALIEEKHIVIVGNKNSGKTTLVLRFVDKDEAPKPTTALEYTFGRRARGPNAVKDVGHIWELGGGASLAKLIDVPLTPECVMNTSILLCVDLSSPNDIWVVTETLISALNSRIESCLTVAARRDNSLWERVQHQTNERLGGEHMDRDLIEPFKIPLVIVGTKFDLYQELEPEKKKVIAKTLRFLAHTYGAALYFSSVRIETTMSKVRSMMSSLVFGTQSTKQVQLDHTKPLVIPAGLDSLQNIGSPPLADNDVGSTAARNPLELWKFAFGQHFPQNSIRGKLTEDPTKDVQFSEPNIDKLRLEKDEELERYRKASERRMKELERQAEVGME